MTSGLKNISKGMENFTLASLQLKRVMMALEKWSGLIRVATKVFGPIKKCMGTVSAILLMEMFIKVNLRTICNMEKVIWHSAVEVIWMVNGKKINFLDKEPRFFQMEIPTLANGIKITLMVLVKWVCRMIVGTTVSG
jgi:hypothetical protein